ncbi:MAG: hypothetical protein ABIQ32_12165 [Sphingomicrobium sp.]
MGATSRTSALITVSVTARLEAAPLAAANDSQPNIFCLWTNSATGAYSVTALESGVAWSPSADGGLVSLEIGAPVEFTAEASAPACPSGKGLVRLLPAPREERRGQERGPLTIVLAPL